MPLSDDGQLFERAISLSAENVNLSVGRTHSLGSGFSAPAL
ncbi:MAG: hypothetical protein NT023_02775 [Armatimonadetes bacterium]|nr:hypothetical protein [Armatimonadota bacterium]